MFFKKKTALPQKKDTCPVKNCKIRDTCQVITNYKFCSLHNIWKLEQERKKRPMPNPFVKRS